MDSIDQRPCSMSYEMNIYIIKAYFFYFYIGCLVFGATPLCCLLADH